MAALLIGDLWRWGMYRENQAEDDFDRSWRQTVRWLVGDVPGRVEVTVRPKTDSETPALRLAARVRDAEYRPLDNAKVTFRVRLPGGDTLTLDGEPDPREAGAYATTYVPREPGAYNIVAAATAPDGSALGEQGSRLGGSAGGRRVCPPRARPRIPENRSRQQTGGEVVDGDRLASFVASLSSRSATDHRAVDVPTLASTALFPDRHRVLAGRMGPEARQWPGMTRSVHRAANESSRQLAARTRRIWIMIALLAICFHLAAVERADQPCVVIVVGAPGAGEYKGQFERWAGSWKAAAGKASAELIGDRHNGATGRYRSRPAAPWSGREVESEPRATLDRLDRARNLRRPRGQVQPARTGSDGRGAGGLAGAVKRPVVVINCASASGPFLNRLSGPKRVVVVATKSGFEMNFSRFGEFLAEAMTDLQADLDKDGQVSLLEAYLTASNRVEEYYRTHSQLATEHALLDDNGDHLGTPASWFKGVRATQRAKDGASLDGLRAHQLHLIPSDREREMPVEIRQRRDELESSIAALRDQKEKLKDDEYYARLEKLLIELARLYRDVGRGEAAKVNAGH